MSARPRPDTPPCDTDGCKKLAQHTRLFTIGSWGDEEIEAMSYFCCEHLDMLDSGVTPCLDLRVVGTVRR